MLKSPDFTTGRFFLTSLFRYWSNQSILFLLLSFYMSGFTVQIIMTYLG